METPQCYAYFDFTRGLDLLAIKTGLFLYKAGYTQNITFFPFHVGAFMAEQNNILGTLCIIVGLLLLFLVSGLWLLQLAVVIASYYVIDYGLALQRQPPLSFYIKRWFNMPRGF